MSDPLLNALLIFIAAVAILALERVIAEESKRLSRREMFYRNGKTNFPIRYVTLSTETNFPMRMVDGPRGTNYVMRHVSPRTDQNGTGTEKKVEVIPEGFIPVRSK